MPYYYCGDGNKIAYIRSGDQSIEAPIQTLNSLILKGQNNTFDALPSPFALHEVSFTLLEATYNNETGDLFRRERDLISFNLAQSDGTLTYAGVLLCDQGLLRQSRIFCTRWKGCSKGSVDNDALDDKEYSGSIISLLENAETFVKNNSQTRWRVLGLRRIEESDYPVRAVREVIVNAIIHRDYQIIGSEIHIDMYDDRLEISSPGGMMNGSRIQDLDLMHIPSMRRNQIISDVFSRLHYMDRRGSGISRILHAYDDCSEKPVFFSEASQFLVTLPNKNTVLQRKNTVIEGQLTVFESENTASEAENTSPAANPFLSSEEEKEHAFITYFLTQCTSNHIFRARTQEKVVELFRQYGCQHSFSREDVSRIFQVQPTRASQIIKTLRENGIITKEKNRVYRFLFPPK